MLHLVEYITISIHAPREGGDVGEKYGLERGVISIHAPREGGDQLSFLPFLLH